VIGVADPDPSAPANDAALPDGTHDALVIDAHDGTDDLGRTTQRLDLTVVAGVSKGQVVTIVTGQPLGDEIALIGMPATITVRGGEPSVVIDD
jgi:hypothetical protein